MDQQKAAAGFALLAEPNRLEILRLLAQGEENAAGLLKKLTISQPTLSHHMRVLCEGGLVESRRQGQRILYRLCLPALRELLAVPLAESAPPPAETPKPSPAPEPVVIIRSGHRGR